MSHNYLLDTYQRVQERARICQKNIVATPPDTEEWFYWRGRLDALKSFYDFLFETFHPRLPRRLMRQHQRFNFPSQAGPTIEDLTPD